LELNLQREGRRTITRGRKGGKFITLEREKVECERKKKRAATIFIEKGGRWGRERLLH